MDEKMKCLIVEVGKEPYIAEIDYDFEKMSDIVSGNIGFYRCRELPDAVVVHDDNFLNDGADFNRYIGNQEMCGTFIVLGENFNEYGERDFCSLTQEQLETFKEVLNGQDFGENQIFSMDSDSEKMKIRVFQKDGFSANYRQIYSGTVDCATLDDVFCLCNTQKPSGYCGKPLSEGDVVEVCEGEEKGFYRRENSDFVPTEFDISKTDHENMLKILIIENSKEPYVAEIRDELEAKQSVVGGLIEPIYFDNSGKSLIFCNEEFLLDGSEPNRFVGDILVHGTFMIVGDGINDDGECVEVSLTDEQIEEFSEMFRYPVIILDNPDFFDEPEFNM